MSTPITTLVLYRTELQPDGVVMDWEAHLAHLQNADKYQVLNCTFQRQDREMRLPLSMDIAGRYNYGSFENNGRRYYCFITDMEYVNDNMTKASYSIDWWHTYQRDIVYKPSMIVRKIVAKEDDVLGRYTAGEDVAPSVYNAYNTWSDYPGVTQESDNAYWYLLIDNGYGVFNPTSHNYGGYTYYGDVIMSDAASSVQARLASLTRVGQMESVQGIWCIPKSVIGRDPNIVDHPITVGQPILMTIPTTVYGYEIKNNKTRTSPYMIVNAFSTDGDDITYRIQDIISAEGDNYVAFMKASGLFPTPSAMLYPRNIFKQENGEMLMSLICQHFPVPNISSGGITIKDAISMIGAGISLGSGIAYQSAARALTRANMASLADSHRDKETGRGGFLTKTERKRADALYALNDAQTFGNVGGGVTNAAAAISSIQTAKGVKGAGTGGEMARGVIGFVVMLMTPDKEQLEEIDSYFTRYGYAIGQIEDIELHNRSIWDYVQTDGASLSIPDAPIEAEVAVKEMFDSGITIFHSSAYFKRYDLNNQ